VRARGRQEEEDGHQDKQCFENNISFGEPSETQKINNTDKDKNDIYSKYQGRDVDDRRRQEPRVIPVDNIEGKTKYRARKARKNAG
jgi:hypothetical protein